MFQGLNGKSKRRQVGLGHIEDRKRMRLLRHQLASPVLPAAWRSEGAVMRANAPSAMP